MKKLIVTLSVMILLLTLSASAVIFDFRGDPLYSRLGCGKAGDPGNEVLPCNHAIAGGSYLVTVKVSNIGDDGFQRIEAMIKKRHQINSFFGSGVIPFQGYTLATIDKPTSNCNPEEHDVVTRWVQLRGGDSKDVSFNIPVPDIQKGDEDSYGIFIEAYKKCWKELTSAESNEPNPVGQTAERHFPLQIIPKSDYALLIKPNIVNIINGTMPSTQSCLTQDDCSKKECQKDQTFLNSKCPIVEGECLYHPSLPQCGNGPKPDVLKFCGNKKVDAGETCMNCQSDVHCDPLDDPKGKQTNTIIFLLILGIIYLLFSSRGRK